MDSPLSCDVGRYSDLDVCTKASLLVKSLLKLPSTSHGHVVGCQKTVGCDKNKSKIHVESTTTGRRHCDTLASKKAKDDSLSSSPPNPIYSRTVIVLDVETMSTDMDTTIEQLRDSVSCILRQYKCNTISTNYNNCVIKSMRIHIYIYIYI